MKSDVIFELIRVATSRQNNISRVPSAEEWAIIFFEAIKQAVVGIAFYGVQRLPDEQTVFLPNAIRMRWLAMTIQIQARNEVVNRRCLELQNLLAKKGLKSCILKGQGVGLLYAEGCIAKDNKSDCVEQCLGQYRQSGDIDVWVKASREELIDYVMNTAPTRDFDQKHIHFQVFEDVDVEMHWIPVKRDSPKFNRILGDFFKKEKERQFANYQGEVCYPTLDFQLVHQLLHVYGHYVYEGVGLRQMMDLFFAQTAFLNSFPEKVSEVLSLFNKLGLMEFVAGAQYALTVLFEVGKDFLLCTPNIKEGELLLQEIEIGGNLGQFDKRNDIKNESFAHRALRRLKRRWRMVRFDPWGTILMPFSRVKLDIWMKRVRNRYCI